jgi:hypothetical protein
MGDKKAEQTLPAFWPNLTLPLMISHISLPRKQQMERKSGSTAALIQRRT